MPDKTDRDLRLEGFIDRKRSVRDVCAEAFGWCRLLGIERLGRARQRPMGSEHPCHARASLSDPRAGAARGWRQASLCAPREWHAELLGTKRTGRGRERLCGSELRFL